MPPRPLARLTLLLSLCLSLHAQAADQTLPGHWQGTLKVSPAIELRLALEITQSPGGELEGVLTSIDQGGVKLPLTTVSEKSGAVEWQVAPIGGAYTGRFSADGAEVAGEWQQAGQKFPLTFKRAAAAPTLTRPQEPKKPYPYTELEVTVENAPAGLKLAGTFTVPSGPGPHPAVILLTGSGPQDRDEAIMGHRPFLVLADHLTRAGIAVLRCDDRGVANSTGDFAGATHTDFVEDALAGVAWLKGRSEVDPRHIGLLGHSEGGVVAPLAAVKNPGDIAFLVLLAGVGVPMEELLVRQGADVARVLGLSEDLIAKSTAAQHELFPQLKAAPDTATAEKIVRESGAKFLAAYTPEQRQAMGMTDAAREMQAKLLVTPWFRQLLAYDPRPTLRQVKCPVLALNGEKD